MYITTSQCTPFKNDTVLHAQKKESCQEVWGQVQMGQESCDAGYVIGGKECLKGKQLQISENRNQKCI